VSLIFILLLSLTLFELGLRLLVIGVSNLLQINCLWSYFLGGLHILKVDVSLLSFLHHLVNLLLREVHRGWRVLILGLDHLLTAHNVGTLLNDLLLRNSNRSLTCHLRLLVVLLSLQVLYELSVVDQAWL
jgi:hypothetical protein